jgi:hypothetical protein
MDECARFSATTLAEAAAGHYRPSKDVALAFAKACGAGDEDLRLIAELWAKADKATRKAHRRRLPAVTKVSLPHPRRLQAPHTMPLARRPLLQPPRPDADGTTAAYVRQLRALRAWAGQPSHNVITRRARHALTSQYDTWQDLPRSTFYDALNPNRVTLPSLDAVQFIVAALDPQSFDAWTRAWQAVKVSEVLRAADAADPEAAAGAADRSEFAG